MTLLLLGRGTHHRFLEVWRSFTQGTNVNTETWVSQNFQICFQTGLFIRIK